VFADRCDSVGFARGVARKVVILWELFLVEMHKTALGRVRENRNGMGKAWRGEFTVKSSI
jgi:hypothetical protein